MAKPTKCSCGGKFKKGSPVSGTPRDGSKYFQCEKCWIVLEQTAEGYEFRDQGTEPKRAIELRKLAAREEARRNAELERWRLGPSIRRFS